MRSPHTPENWNEASEHYDEHITPWTGQFAEEAIRAAELGDDARVLEVAAGGGALTLPLAPLCGELLAVDYSQGMLDRLRSKIEASGHTHVRLQQMDGMALDLEDESFDYAFSQFAVMLFGEPARGLSELCRVLVPGGRAVVTAWAGPEHFDTFAIFGEAMRRALPDHPKPDGPPPIFSLSDVEVFTSMLKDAGFSEARVDHVTRTWSVDSADEFVKLFFISAPPGRQLAAAIGPEATGRVKEAMHDVLAERFGVGPVELSNTATLGVARR
jgi:ubiquinone/menaquinone biosynthesis C-methylase UbiE